MLVYFALAVQPIQPDAARDRTGGGRRALPGDPDRAGDWIDRAVEDDQVAVIWTGGPNRFTVKLNEFFKSCVGPIYTLGGPMAGGLPETASRRPRDR